MSVSIITLNRNIQNQDPITASFDLDTRNAFLSTFVGYLAGSKNTGMANTMLGYGSGQDNDIGASNVFISNFAGANNTSGDSSVFIGANAGASNVSGSDNLFIGTLAGSGNTTGSKNIMMGSSTGAQLNGIANILIGYGNSASFTTPYSSCNISIGTSSRVVGNNNIMLGNNSYANGVNSIVLGNNSTDRTGNNILIGKNITSFGCNCLIMMTGITTSNPYVNYSNNVVNINNALFMSKDSSTGQQSFSLQLDNVVIGNSSNQIKISPTSMNLSAID